jgi:hypothetical protein
MPVLDSMLPSSALGVAASGTVVPGVKSQPPLIQVGTGTPTHAAPQGTLYLQLDGGSGSTLWVKSAGGQATPNANGWSVAGGGAGGTDPITPPVNGDFAWVNQGGASVTVTGSNIYIKDPGGSATDHLRLRVKAVPVAPYTVTIGFIPAILQLNNLSVGLCLRDSASGKIVSLDYTNNAGPLIAATKWNSPTSFNASYSTAAMHPTGAVLYFRIADDGVNRVSSWSFDGVNFNQFFSVGRTDFITPDQIGFFANGNNATYDACMNVISWLEA